MPKTLTCDWKTSKGKGNPSLKTRLIKHRCNYTWKGIKIERYKSDDSTWFNASRRVLTGTYGEKTRFHVRYFQIAPQGYTTLERHRHEHVVVGIRGRGLCRVNGKSYRIGFLDTLYIEPHAGHQLKNPYNEPFGFFCLVDAKRDKPKVLKGR
ncbi:MAG: cupin domain-containing protein [Nitrospirae bacterium]|nr:cupin domain-containing protein [Nitrospirota bacterium]